MLKICKPKGTCCSLREKSTEILSTEAAVSSAFQRLQCPWFVHVLKLASLSGEVFHGYVGIRFRGLSFVNVSSIVSYCGPFQRAFRVKTQQGGMKTLIHKACQAIRENCLKKGMATSVEALENTGISVG